MTVWSLQTRKRTEVTDVLMPNWDPFYNHGLTLIPPGISNHMACEVWNYLWIPNFNGSTVELWEWVTNFNPQIIVNVITYPCWDSSYSILVQGLLGYIVLSTDLCIWLNFEMASHVFGESLTSEYLNFISRILNTITKVWTSSIFASIHFVMIERRQMKVTRRCLKGTPIVKLHLLP